MIFCVAMVLGFLLWLGGIGGFLINILILGGLELLGILFSGVFGFILLGLSIKYILLRGR